MPGLKLGYWTQILVIPSDLQGCDKKLNSQYSSWVPIGKLEQNQPRTTHRTMTLSLKASACMVNPMRNSRHEQASRLRKLENLSVNDVSFFWTPTLRGRSFLCLHSFQIPSYSFRGMHIRSEHITAAKMKSVANLLFSCGSRDVIPKPFE
jgi:hypothetical protein